MSDTKEVLVDPELKEMIVQNLESTGSLAKIRAQLRKIKVIFYSDVGFFAHFFQLQRLNYSIYCFSGAATYLVLEGQQEFPASTSSARMRSLLQTDGGILAARLVRDFLLHADLHHTLGVFDAESGGFPTSAEEERNSLSMVLHVSPVSDQPILLQLVDSCQSAVADSTLPGESQRPKTADRRQKFTPHDSGDDGRSVDDNDALDAWLIGRLIDWLVVQ